MRTLCLLIVLGWTQLAFTQNNLTGDAASLFKKAKASKFYSTVERLNPEVFPTSDGRSFLTIWRAKDGASAPKRWIVSLPGTRGFATDDLAIWSPHLKGRAVGLLSVQWWLGGDNPRDSYYTPEQVYREVDIALQKLGARPGTVMLHGFSRGSANSYAIVALDAGRGRKYFALNVASSGGVGLDYPPTRAIAAGVLGNRPLQGTRWITCAGGRDPQPERDGIPGMRRTATWLKEQGATVLESIEDQNSGHGALVTNPKNAKRVLDLFLAEKP
jgi:hypothetical protein